MALDQVCRIASINAVYVTLNMRGQDRKIQDLLRLLLQCLTLLINRNCFPQPTTIGGGGVQKVIPHNTKTVYRRRPGLVRFYDHLCTLLTRGTTCGGIHTRMGLYF